MTVTPNSPPAAKGKQPRESAHVANKSGGAVSEVLELGKTIFYALLIALILRVVLFQPFTIPSESMEPTLLKGDYIIVSKFAYGWSRHSIPFSPPIGHGRLLGHAPKRGDIIVFKLPRDGKTDYIKRLIGLPGDRLQVVHGHLQINGTPVARQDEPPAQEETAFGGMINLSRFHETLPGGRQFTTNSYGPDGPADNTGVYTVPAGCYFMMGDNRDNSLDSRFDPGDPAPGEASCPWNHDVDRFIPPDLGVGFVPAEDLVGRADIILFSWRPGVSVLEPWTWFTTARWDRFFHLL
jgi:signal peptidase I